MFPILVILFTVLPILELTVLIKVGTAIGVLNTVLLTLAISITGAALARLQGFFVLQKIQNSLLQGRMPTDDMLDGLMILMGGILLLTPGFITDAIGLAMLFPGTRWMVKFLARGYLNYLMKSGRSYTFTHISSRNDDDILDV